MYKIVRAQIYAQDTCIIINMLQGALSVSGDYKLLIKLTAYIAALWQYTVTHISNIISTASSAPVVTEVRDEVSHCFLYCSPCTVRCTC